MNRMRGRAEGNASRALFRIIDIRGSVTRTILSKKAHPRPVPKLVIESVFPYRRFDALTCWIECLAPTLSIRSGTSLTRRDSVSKPTNGIRLWPSPRSMVCLVTSWPGLIPLLHIDPFLVVPACASKTPSLTSWVPENESFWASETQGHSELDIWNPWLLEALFRYLSELFAFCLFRLPITPKIKEDFHSPC